MSYSSLREYEKGHAHYSKFYIVDFFYLSRLFLFLLLFSSMIDNQKYFYHHEFDFIFNH